MVRDQEARKRDGASRETAGPRRENVSTSSSGALSVRAINVLKELAPELIGETPPKGEWIPPRDLLQQLTARQLMVARNCGPQTAREIIAWALGQGVSIRSPLYVGKSLSEVWHSLAARASTGKLTRVEITEALEKSIRRKSVRIPVAFQIILLEILSSTYDPPLP
jgi:hypothetical protein